MSTPCVGASHKVGLPTEADARRFDLVLDRDELVLYKRLADNTWAESWSARAGGDDFYLPGVTDRPSYKP